MPQFTVPKHILIGQTALQEAKDILPAFGKKALLVAGPHVAKSEAAEQVKSLLSEIGTQVCIFDKITGEPTDTMIREGLKLYKDEGCDYVIGFGGGSPLDSAKAIAAMSVNPGKIADYNGRQITGEVPPVVAIPTTAGTGSEATKMTIVTDTQKDIKMLLMGAPLVPSLAIVVPSFTLEMPQKVTAATGLDALTHAVEAYTSKKAFCMTDTLALSAVKRIMKYLPAAFADGQDKKAREEMAVAALEAGICINNSSVTLVHGMSRPIGALFHVPHGISNAMLLKECLTFALSGAYSRFADLSRYCGFSPEGQEDQEAAEIFLEEIEKLCQSLKVPSLQEYGIDREAFYAQIPKMAEDAVASGSPGNTRKQVEAEDCIQIYKRLYP